LLRRLVNAGGDVRQFVALELMRQIEVAGECRFEKRRLSTDRFVEFGTIGGEAVRRSETSCGLSR
jgi:hypothetical protein